jgi:hypothetical protein
LIVVLLGYLARGAFEELGSRHGPGVRPTVSASGVGPSARAGRGYCPADR